MDAIVFQVQDSVFFLHQSGAELRIEDGGVNAIFDMFDEKRKKHN